MITIEDAFYRVNIEVETEVLLIQKTVFVKTRSDLDKLYLAQKEHGFRIKGFCIAHRQTAEEILAELPKEREI